MHVTERQMHKDVRRWINFLDIKSVFPQSCYLASLGMFPLPELQGSFTGSGPLVHVSTAETSPEGHLQEPWRSLTKSLQQGRYSDPQKLLGGAWGLRVGCDAEPSRRGALVASQLTASINMYTNQKRGNHLSCFHIYLHPCCYPRQGRRLCDSQHLCVCNWWRVFVLTVETVKAIHFLLNKNHLIKMLTIILSCFLET